MISALNFTSINGDSIDFSVGETAPVDYYPVFYFDPTNIPMRGDSRPKMQSPGSWPRNQIPSEMPIEIHGAILADDATDMVNKRKALVKAIMPFGPLLIPQQYTGQVSIVLEGTSETLTTDVGLQTWQAPVDSTKFSPLVVEFQIVWVSYTPWWTDPALDAVLL